jgi:hypothetical protein
VLVGSAGRPDLAVGDRHREIVFGIELALRGRLKQLSGDLVERSIGLDCHPAEIENGPDVAIAGAGEVVGFVFCDGDESSTVPPLHTTVFHIPSLVRMRKCFVAVRVHTYLSMDISQRLR